MIFSALFCRHGLFRDVVKVVLSISLFVARLFQPVSGILSYSSPVGPNLVAAIWSPVTEARTTGTFGWVAQSMREDWPLQCRTWGCLPAHLRKFIGEFVLVFAGKSCWKFGGNLRILQTHKPQSIFIKNRNSKNPSCQLRSADANPLRDWSLSKSEDT